MMIMFGVEFLIGKVKKLNFNFYRGQISKFIQVEGVTIILTYFSLTKLKALGSSFFFFLKNHSDYLSISAGPFVYFHAC